MTAEPRTWTSLRLSRSGTVLTTLVAITGAVMMYLLSTASSNTPLLAGHLTWLLGAGVALVVGLMLVTGHQLLGLRRRLRQRVFGSKLSLRLVLLFSLVAVLPGALVYAVSVQFLVRSIDTWFDIRVEKALEGGLALGRTTLDTMLSDLRHKADAMSLSLSDGSLRQQRSRLNTLRDQAAVQEAAVFDTSGHVIAFTSDEKDALAPVLPSSEVLRDIRLQRSSSRIVVDPRRGLLLRVIVPVNLRGGGVEALQLVQKVRDDIARDAESVQDAYAEYQELSYSRPGLKRLYGLSLTLALLLALFFALLLAIYFSQRLAAPLGVLAEGTRAVAQGDFSERAEVASYDELGILTGSFNTMTRELAEARGATQKYQGELEAAKVSLESILSNLSSGVISLDVERRLRSANPGAHRILGVALDALQDQPVEAWGLTDPRLAAIAGPLEEALTRPLDRLWEREVVYASEHGELTLLVRVSAITQQGTIEGFVVVFDDITNLLRAQRQAAWGEVARRLAHEIKNPLTPIQLSAERLQQRLHPKLEQQDGEMLSRLTHTIVNQVTALKGMVDTFSQYARSPDADLRPLDLAQLARDVLGLYESLNAAIVVRIEPGLDPVRGDAAKLRQVIHNLLRNAEDAVGSVTMPRITVSVERAEGGVALRVADNGAGFPADLLARPFEPYVTTKPKGTGLGLAIVKKIVEEHGGVIHLENMVAGGARVSVILPDAALAARVVNG